MIRVRNPLCSPLLEQASALRRAGSLCDVVFLVGGQRFRAHRLVLACTSPSLAPQLLQEAPDRLLHLALDLCSPRTFQQVLDYSYGRALALVPGDLAGLWTAAGLLGMAALEEQCRLLLDHRTTDPRQAPGDAEEWRADSDRGSQASPAPGETLPRNVSPEEETEEEEETSCPPTPPPPPCDTPQGQAGEAPSKRRAGTSSMLAAPHSRDSVIRASSPCPPWSYVNNCPPWVSVNNWHHVTLRLMAQGYSNLLAIHSLQHPPPLAPHALHPSPRAAGLGPADSAHVQARRPSAGSPDLEETVCREPCPEAESSEPRCFKRIPSPQHVFLNPLHASHVLKKCPPSSGEAYHRYVSRGGAGGVTPGPKPFQCQQCPKRFSLKHQLETHHRVHTGAKPFECHLCGQRSRDYSAMIKHLRTHGGAGPYQCTACQDFCSSLVAMQKHVERHAAQDFPPDWTIRHTYLYTFHV